VAAGANTRVKGFADACYKGEEDITEDIICYKDRESE
jgi:hypothetical protein